MFKIPEGCDFEPTTAPEAYLQQENIKLKLTALKAQAKLTAEREISDKLEKALAFFIEWGYCAAASNNKAREALAEVAAIRAKDQK